MSFTSLIIDAFLLAYRVLRLTLELLRLCSHDLFVIMNFIRLSVDAVCVDHGMTVKRESSQQATEPATKKPREATQAQKQTASHARLQASCAKRRPGLGAVR
jgi:hypothetical protein